MEFPTIDEVNAAARIDICRWHRFLPSATTAADQAIQGRIFERFNAVGGFTPAISKMLGWDKR